MEDLIGINVPDPGEERLVEKQALQPSPPSRDPAGEIVAADLERLGTQGGQLGRGAERGGLQAADEPEFADIAKAELSRSVPETEKKVGMLVAGRPPFLPEKLPGHLQMEDQRKTALAGHDEVFAPPADRGDPPAAKRREPGGRSAAQELGQEETDIVDDEADGPPAQAGGDRFDLGQLGHGRIIPSFLDFGSPPENNDRVTSDPPARMSRIRSASPPRLDRETCCACGGCVGVCPADALTLEETTLDLDARICDGCGLCVDFCPVAALSFPEGRDTADGAEESAITADAVVVGAGPAGSICAKFLAQAGLDVLVVDKRQEVGAPKRCAEGLSPRVLAEVGVGIDPRWTTARIARAVLHAPGGGSVAWAMGDERDYGVILERKVFDKLLLRDAVRAGARTMIKTSARGVVRTDGRVSGVVVEHMGRRRTIGARLVVAADGVDSKIARSAGIPSAVRPGRIMSCFQYEMAGLDSLKESEIHLFYGNRIAPGGYAWIFPKGGGTANVGLGVKTRLAGGRTAREFLDRFISSRPETFGRAQALEINCGGVPVHPSSAPLVADGLMIVGDAARMVNPITGGGIKLAMLSGKMAAEVAAGAFRVNDLGARALRNYPDRWEKEHGRALRKLLKLQRFADRLTDEDFDRMADILSPEILEQMKNARFGAFTARVLRKLPHLSPLVVKYLRS